MNPTLKAVLCGALLVFSTTASPAHAMPEVDSAIFERIVSQGVPRASLTRIVAYVTEMNGREVSQDTYVCQGRPSTDFAPCEERMRSNSTTTVTIVDHRYGMVLDFGRPSDEKRLFLIDFQSGDVKSFYSTHGVGSGTGRYATTFSNRKNSKQSSLGLYQVGGVYNGKYGSSLRLYGLEPSNDQAYQRDIVMHGAAYARRPSIKYKDADGRTSFRLGLSWGCPAVDPAVMVKLIPLLKDGAILDLFYPDSYQD